MIEESRLAQLWIKMLKVGKLVWQHHPSSSLHDRHTPVYKFNVNANLLSGCNGDESDRARMRQIKVKGISFQIWLSKWVVRKEDLFWTAVKIVTKYGAQGPSGDDVPVSVFRAMIMSGLLFFVERKRPKKHFRVETILVRIHAIDVNTAMFQRWDFKRMPKIVLSTVHKQIKPRKQSPHPRFW